MDLLSFCTFFLWSFAGYLHSVAVHELLQAVNLLID